MAEQLTARFAFPRLVVRDLHRQAAFYRSAFGYGEGQTIKAEIKGRPIEEIIFTASDGKVELILLAYGDGSRASSDGAMLGFVTQDLEAFETRVLAAGGSVFQPIGPMEAGGKTARLGFYADPEGFLLEIIQW